MDPRSEWNLYLTLGDVMSNFDGFVNISYQCLDQEEIECKEPDIEDTLTTAGTQEKCIFTDDE